jgi:hypothetical protein
VRIAEAKSRSVAFGPVVARHDFLRQHDAFDGHAFLIEACIDRAAAPTDAASDHEKHEPDSEPNAAEPNPEVIVRDQARFAVTPGCSELGDFTGFDFDRFALARDPHGDLADR